MIFNNNEKEGIHSGGFSVNSIMLKKGISPIQTLNYNMNNQTGGSQVSDLFNSLVVPNWAYTSGKITSGGNPIMQNKYDSDDEDGSDVIDDDLHAKLMDLVTQPKKMSGGKKSKRNMKKENNNKENNTKETGNKENRRKTKKIRK